MTRCTLPAIEWFHYVSAPCPLYSATQRAILPPLSPHSRVVNPTPPSMPPPVPDNVRNDEHYRVNHNKDVNVEFLHSPILSAKINNVFIILSIRFTFHRKFNGCRICEKVELKIPESVGITNDLWSTKQRAKRYWFPRDWEISTWSINLTDEHNQKESLDNKCITK